MTDSVSAIPTGPEEFSRRYDSSIVVRRWGATVLDFLFLALFLVAPLALSESSQPPAYAVGLLIAIAYFPILERLYGRTLGKLACRLRVVDAKGALPSWGQVALRTLLRLLEVNPALMGGIPAGIAVLASKKRQRLGDMAAGTFVLREVDYRYLSHRRDYEAGGGPGLRAEATAAPPLLPPLPPPSSSAESWLLPTNRSGWCIAAGYLGLFAILGLPAPFALTAGIVGLKDLNRHPHLGGRGRAVFGIILGALFTVLYLVVLLASVFGSK